MQIFKNFIALNEDKSPKSCNGRWRIITGSQLQTEKNVGGVIADNIALVDYDDMQSAECFLNLVRTLKLKTQAIKTDRGIHFYFKHTKQDNLKSISHYLNGLGLEGDIKVGNKNSYAMIKRNGVLRRIIYGVENDELEEMPFYLYPIKHLKAGEKSDLLGLSEGEGRNSELSKFKLILNGKGYTAEQIKLCLSLINSFVFKEPLSESELNTVARDESNSELFKESFGKYKITNFEDDGKKTKQEILEKAREKKQSLEEEKKQWFLNFTKEIIEKYHFVQIKGIEKNLFYYYTDNHYELLVNEDLLKKLILEEGLEKQKIFTSTEINSYILLFLKSLAPLFTQEYFEQDTNLYLATNNKLIVFSKDRKIKVIEPSYRYFCTSKINVDYEEKTEPTEVDTFLKTISNNNKETEQLIKEVIGYCIYPKNIFRKSFFLIGNGGNGKSTYLNLINKFLGNSNTTNISLYDIENNRFATANLKDKLANLGDDITADDFEKLNNFKIISSGDTLSAEFKGAQSFSFKPYCKLIFSCNVAPLMYETTEGIKSRVVYVPFEKKFIAKGKIKMLNYIEKIIDKTNLTRLLSIALESLETLLDRGCFIETQAGKQKAEELMRESDEVYSFALDYEAQGNVYDGKPVSDIYRSFVNYLRVYCPKRRIITINSFSRRLRSLYDGLITKKQRIENKIYTIFYATKEIEPLADILVDTEQEQEQENTQEQEQEEEKKEEVKNKKRGRLVSKKILVKKAVERLAAEGKQEIDESEMTRIINSLCSYLKATSEQDIQEIKDYTTGALTELGAVDIEKDDETYWILPGSVVYEKYKSLNDKVTPPTFKDTEN